MQKDIIYIDVEDDITAIIGKVKNANQKIVALVPPKHVGVLQSAVNMHLLARSASQSGKRLVLISNNPALMALSAAAKIPVAKNLQSKPELALIPALDIDDGEDIIDGANLPVGELAKTADRIPVSGMVPESAVDEASRASPINAVPRAVPLTFGSAASTAKPRVKGGSKVPNFNLFRKKLILMIGGAVAVVAFLVWAIAFAPQATILITARTSTSAANIKVTIDDTVATDVAAATVKSTTAEIKKDVSVSFDATGKKDVGEKAKGQVTFKNCETLSPQTIPSGTLVTANGVGYLTQAAVTVPAGVGGFGGCTTAGVSDPVTIVASDIGDSSNTPNGTTFSVAGHANSSAALYFRAIASTDIAGGSKRQVAVVSSSDIQKATEQLAKQNTDDIKKQLVAKLGNNVVSLTDSFTASQAAVVSTPAADVESTDGKAKLTSSVTYSSSGVGKDEVGRFLDAYFAKQLSKKNDRRVYSNGADKATFNNIVVAGSGLTGSIATTAHIGPKINDDDIKTAAKGKRYGEIQSAIQAVEGVDNVDIKFSPFWVNTAPSDTKRINVVFNLNESK